MSGVRKVLLAVGIAAFVAAAVWFIHGVMSSKDTKPPRMTQTITVIKTPPPPPPDQPPPPPPPDRPQEQIPQDQPEPSPSNDPAPSEQLGLDAEGSAGGDSFGLAARKGGHDLAGSGGAIFGWYTSRIKDRIAEKLGADAKLKAKRFTVAVRVWVDPDGRIRDVKVASSTGNGELDSAIQAAVTSIGQLSDRPPVEMPQPVTIRIVARTG